MIIPITILVMSVNSGVIKGALTVNKKDTLTLWKFQGFWELCAKNWGQRLNIILLYFSNILFSFGMLSYLQPPYFNTTSRWWLPIIPSLVVHESKILVLNWANCSINDLHTFDIPETQLNETKAGIWNNEVYIVPLIQHYAHNRYPINIWW